MRHIFLIGLSGSGKSTVGRLLERDLGMPLLDIDALIEEECGERIPAIFAHHGEEYFRSCESLLLDRVTRTQNAAHHSTGGGIVTRAENRALMAGPVCASIYKSSQPLRSNVYKLNRSWQSHKI